MLENPRNILCVIAVILAVGGIIRPQWPLVAVAVLLVAIAVLLIGR